MVRVQQKARGRTTGSAENTRPSLRNGFNGVFRALPGDHRLVATVVHERFRGLSACFGAPGPHGLTVRARVSRLLPRSRPPHPASTFVTTRTPLFDEAGRRKDTQFPVIRNRNFRAWPTENPNRIESPQQISIYAHPIWQRKSPVSEAIVGKIAQILPDGQISDAPRSIAESGLRSAIPLLCPNLRQLSAACGHGRTCWRPDAVANDPTRTFATI